MSPRIVAIVLLAGSVAPGDPRGIAPRASRAEYEVTCFTEALALGATMVSSDKVRRLFGPEVDREYIVVEVGFYSKTKSAFPVRHLDFALKRPKSPEKVKPDNPGLLCDRLAVPQRRAAMENSSLPEVTTSAAVAGYLFFRSPAWGGSDIELDYQGNGAWLTLPLR